MHNFFPDHPRRYETLSTKHVVLARVAPPQKGHIGLIRKVMEKTGEPPVLLLGSSNVFDHRTPFFLEERTLLLAMAMEGVPLKIIPLPDREPDPTRHGDSVEWINDIRKIEASYGQSWVLHGGSEACLKSLKQGGFQTEVTVDRQTEGMGISATEVRKRLAANDIAGLRELLPTLTIELTRDLYHKNIKELARLKTK